MPVRNAMPFLDDAVASILAQTHGHFELVIGDDQSTDGSSERMREWARRDSRIRLIHNCSDRLGPSGSGNWVTRAASYPLIARMDADDISMPDRLRRELLALRGDPDAVLAGSLYECVDADGRRVGGRDRSAFRNPRCVFPVAHGSMMFRRDAFERAGGYRAQCDYWEDVDFFIRIGREGRILVLPESLYRYRYSATSSRQVSNEAVVARALDLCVRCLAAHREGRDYQPLLEQEAGALPRTKVVPSVLAQVALQRLWRGDARSIFSSWAFRHTSFRRDMRSARILIFASWAAISPRSLRAFLRMRSNLADWRARHAVPDGTVKAWQTRELAHAAPAAPSPEARSGGLAGESQRGLEPGRPAVARSGAL
jgi:cellulose synthase/poly-beta-1,6-N-acetylglucosamine synthase-like glycosyltransferase